MDQDRKNCRQNDSSQILLAIKRVIRPRGDNEADKVGFVLATRSLSVAEKQRMAEIIGQLYRGDREFSPRYEVQK